MESGRSCIEATKKDGLEAHPFCFPILLTCKKHFLFSFYVAKIGILKYMTKLYRRMTLNYRRMS